MIDGSMFRQGRRVRVKVTGQVGSVTYVRRYFPQFDQIAAVSVRLDTEVKTSPYYIGTIFQPHEIEPEKKED